KTFIGSGTSSRRERLPSLGIVPFCKSLGASARRSECRDGRPPGDVTSCCSTCQKRVGESSGQRGRLQNVAPRSLEPGTGEHHDQSKEDDENSRAQRSKNE